MEKSVYRNFGFPEQAYGFLIPILEENNIPWWLESAAPMSHAIVGNNNAPGFALLVRNADFPKVNEAIERFVFENPVDEEHYLNAFNNTELLGILDNPTGWNIEDYATAKKLLANRGFQINNDEITQNRQAKLEALHQGKDISLYSMTLWALSIPLGLFVHLAFFVAALGMGYYYWKDMSTDPDGNRYQTFKPRTQSFGKWLLFGGIISLLGFLAYAMYELYVAV